MKQRHRTVAARLIDENESRRVNARHRLDESSAARLDVGSTLLRRTKALFPSGSPP